MNRLRAVCTGLLCMAGFVISDMVHGMEAPDDAQDKVVVRLNTSDQQKVSIRRAVAEKYSTTLKDVLDISFEEADGAIPVAISSSTLTILINLLEAVEIGMRNQTIRRNAHDEPIAQHLQAVVDQVGNPLDQSTLAALLSAAEFLGLPDYLINGVVHTYVWKIDTDNATRPGLMTQIRKRFSPNLQEHLHEQIQLKDGRVKDELSLADYIALNGQPQIDPAGGLNLSEKKLTSLVGFDLLDGTDQIVSIDLSYNSLRSLPNSFLADTPRLEYVYLQNNKLSVLPDTFLANTPQLWSVDLSNNELSALPNTFLADTPRLEHVYLSNNELSVLPNSFLANTPQLRSVDLKNNQLSELPNSFLANTPQLWSVDLKNNQLSVLPNSFLENTRQLERVYLQNNKLSVPSKALLENTPRLKKVDLKNNQLSVLPENFLANTPQLKKVNLKNNKLSVLPNSSLVHSL